MVEARMGNGVRIRRVAQRVRVPAGMALTPLLIFASRPAPGLLCAGGVIAVAGLMIRAWASGYLKKNLVLSVGGPYAYTRNPLYLGTFIMGGGIAVASGSWWFGCLYIGLYLLVYVPVMYAESDTLAQLFGVQYFEYRREVPLFVPRLTPYRPSETSGGDRTGGFAISQYLKHREYRAALGLAAVFAVLAAKYMFFSR